MMTRATAGSGVRARFFEILGAGWLWSGTQSLEVPQSTNTRLHAREVVERPGERRSSTVDTEPTTTSSPVLTLRPPTRPDGARMWRFVREHGGLELNTAYAYVLLADDLSATSSVADGPDGDLAGFVLGFRRPARPDTLFVWQVGVSPAHRGQGLARRLILDTLARQPDDVRFLEATVTPSNTASQRLFRSVAAALETDCQVREYLTVDDFPEGDHEAEDLFRIGPF